MVKRRVVGEPRHMLITKHCSVFGRGWSRLSLLLTYEVSDCRVRKSCVHMSQDSCQDYYMSVCLRFGSGWICCVSEHCHRCDTGVRVNPNVSPVCMCQNTVTGVTLGLGLTLTYHLCVCVRALYPVTLGLGLTLTYPLCACVSEHCNQCDTGARLNPNVSSVCVSEH